MTMFIRKANKDDIEILLQFGKELHFVEKEFENNLEYSDNEARTRYLHQLENPLALFLIMEDDTQRPIGYLYAHAEKKNSDSLDCELEVIYLLPQFQGKGLSQQLINECIRWAKEKNIQSIKTEIFAQNAPSRKAFEKNGFEPYLLVYSLKI